MIEKMSQNEAIFNYLVNGGQATALDALHDFGTMRLPSRIHNLREILGPNMIDDEWQEIHPTERSAGGGFGVKRVKRYFILKGNREEAQRRFDHAKGAA